MYREIGEADSFSKHEKKSANSIFSKGSKGNGHVQYVHRYFVPYLLELGHLFLREHGEDAGAAAFSLATAAAARPGGTRFLRCTRRGWWFLLGWRGLGFWRRSLLLLLGLLLLFLIRLCDII